MEKFAEAYDKAANSVEPGHDGAVKIHLMWIIFLFTLLQLLAVSAGEILKQYVADKVK